MMLYVIPPTGVDILQCTVEFPILKQLVRVMGSIDNSYAEPGGGTIILNETQSNRFAGNIKFDGLMFVGTKRSDLELCTLTFIIDFYVLTLTVSYRRKTTSISLDSNKVISDPY